MRDHKRYPTTHTSSTSSMSTGTFSSPTSAASAGSTPPSTGPSSGDGPDSSTTTGTVDTSPSTTDTTSPSLTPTTADTTTTPNTTPSAVVTVVSKSGLNDGAIAGGVIGGVVFLALLILGIILFRRARRRKHIAPSSEFAETMKRGEMPVLRLDSGVEIVPTTPHHIFLPHRFRGPAMSEMKFPDGMMWSDEQSARYSLQKPLQPLRYPVHKDSDDSMMHPGYVGSSIDTSHEHWSGEPANNDTRRDFVSPFPDPGYQPLLQNTYPMSHSHAMETVQDSYANLWQLSVAQSRSLSRRYNGDGQAQPPLVPVRHSTSVGAHMSSPLAPVRRSGDIGQMYGSV